MKIVFFCIGTRGDIQPSCVLGQELKNRGYHVRIATEERCKYVVEKFDLEYFQIVGDGCQILFAANEDDRKWMNSLSLEALMREKKRTDMNTPGRMESFYYAAEGFDLIIPSALSTTEAFCINEKLKIPFLPIVLQPTIENGAFPHLFFSDKNLYFKFLHKLTYKMVCNYCLKHESERVDTWRKNFLKLGPLPKAGILNQCDSTNQQVLVALHEKILKFEKKPIEWGENICTPGFLFPDVKNLTPIPEHVVNFIEKGTSPMVFGLGSMPNPYSKEVIEMVKSVIRKMKIRCIFLKGWTILNDLKDEEDIIFVDNVDHGLLYHRCSLIVHHGGVGSTAAALRSGVPSIVAWMYFDQPYWGKRVEELGCGKQIKLNLMTEEKLFETVNEIYGNSTYKTRAQEVAIEINKANGAKDAADFVEQSMEKFSRVMVSTSVNINNQP